MTKITFYKSGGVFYGFREQGHTGYDIAGKDILCAAISAMTMLVINAVEVSYATRVDYNIDEETTDIKVIVPSALPEYESDEKKRYAVSGLIAAYYYQLNDMLEDYYDYLEVDETDVPLDTATKL
ncbi:MAG: ribosomal-processing cysteine protease Prp [Clostridiales bacterium]|nr:ribosomal-processing cysteine protease Prp [Clostridiales bacterium]